MELPINTRYQQIIPMAHKIVRVTTPPPTSSPNTNRSDKLGGRYSVGGKSTYLAGRIGWWEPTNFTRDVSDHTVLVGHKYHMRPDLFAYDFYGKSTLMWFILQYNSILDVTEFVPGLQLILPTKSRLLTQMLTKTN